MVVDRPGELEVPAGMDSTGPTVGGDEISGRVDMALGTSICGVSPSSLDR